MVSCLFKDYFQSVNCRSEITLAHQLRKPIIPLKFEEMKWPPQGELSMILTRLVYIDMTRRRYGDIPRDKFQQLVEKIKEHVG